MATDDVVANEVRGLRGEVEDMSRTLSAMARTSGSQEVIAKEFEKDATLLRVFVAVRTADTQEAIVSQLAQEGVELSQQTVSRKLKSLDEEWDLVKAVSRDKLGTHYVHTRFSKDLKLAVMAERMLKKVK
jgi:hypothetical protein